MIGRYVLKLARCMQCTRGFAAHKRESLYSNPRIKKPAVPQSISEMKRVREYVREFKDTPGKSLNECASRNLRAIVREASKDTEFATFLESFKKNHSKSFKRVVDMRTDEQAAELLEKTFKEREDDMEMAEEFRRRRKIANLYNMPPDQDEDKELPPQYQEWLDRIEVRSKREIDFFREESQALDYSVKTKPIREAKELDQMFFTWQKFGLMILHADSITNITRLK
eukprot:TRINITY_DN3177_c0_g1_i13.p1 TRINITY_DN3177_c0_g1~~TRINITY_DN3177_c0_g1_i13.p1  ORF type:complete len:226 (-),score=76.67 TRINITY_DN3177_c0_g1_i13:611-1288(-)